jgi:hypothetical protein
MPNITAALPKAKNSVILSEPSASLRPPNSKKEAGQIPAQGPPHRSGGGDR